MRFPLYTKILLWFFLNLIFLATVALLLAHGQFHFGLEALISGPAGARFQNVTQLLADDLRANPQSDWDAILKRVNDVYKVEFTVFERGQQVGGVKVELPTEVAERINRRPPRLQNRPQGEPERAEPNRNEPPPESRPPNAGPTGGPMGPRVMLHSTNPSRYWVLTPVNLRRGEGPQRGNLLMIVAMADNLSGGGLFFDLTNWAIAGAAVLVISVLFWFPLVRGITRAISKMTRATELIAEGKFDVRTKVSRRDELGALSEAINRMAERLAGFVTGQKRFLGDIAHELCSPIARIQVATGILEQRADPTQKEYLADLREEVEEMSRLVNELLSFSKSALIGKNVLLKPVELLRVVEKAVRREEITGQTNQILYDIDENVRVEADEDLLARALGNILQNAIFHGGAGKSIRISAINEGKMVTVMVEDEGPGIPEDVIGQVFDPFYRVDGSRDRQTGGVGLGLSIVKTCVESCGGTVRCENRAEGGLRVVIKLMSA